METCMLDRILSAAVKADNGPELKKISELLQGISVMLEDILSALNRMDSGMSTGPEYPEKHFKELSL